MVVVDPARKLRRSSHVAVAGVEARAGARGLAAARRVAPAGEATVVEAPRELADASEVVSDAVPEAAPAPDLQLSFDFNSPADGAEIAPRELPTPSDAATDFRWLW